MVPIDIQQGEVPKPGSTNGEGPPTIAVDHGEGSLSAAARSQNLVGTPLTNLLPLNNLPKFP